MGTYINSGKRNRRKEFVYYSIHDIIKIKTNVEIPIPDYFRSSEELDPDMEILQGDLDNNIPRDKMKKRADYYIYKRGSALFFDYSKFFLHVKLKIDNLYDKPTIIFTKNYKKFGRTTFTSLVNAILSIKLIQKGHTFIHAGCLNYDKKQALLISGMAETGKTSSILSLLDGKRFKFMSDDQTILSKNGEAYSYPKRVGISPYTLTGDMISRSKLKKMLKRSEAKEIPQNLIERKGMIKKLFILECGEDKIEQIDRSEAVRKIFTSSMEENNFFRVFPLNLYFFSFGYDYLHLLNNMKNIIEQSLNKVECFKVSSNRVEKYPEMIKDTI